MHSGFSALRQQCPMDGTHNSPLNNISIELQTDLNRLQKLWQDGLNQFGGPWLAGSEFTAVDAFLHQLPFEFAVITYL